MKKKTLSICLIMMASATLLFANGKTEEKAMTPDSSGKVDLLFSTFQVGTSNYNQSAGLSQMWLPYLPAGSTIDVQPTSPGGMGAPYLFANHMADIAFVNGAPAKWAYEKGSLGKPATQEFRALVGSMSSVSAVNFMTQSFIDKYGYDQIEDVIANKVPIRIGCSPKGSMDFQCIQLLFDYLGVTIDDIKSWGGDVVHGNGSELQAMVKDGKLDMVLDHTTSSSSNMTEIAMAKKVHFTQWKEATLDWFCNEQGFERIVLPANSFKYQTEAVIDAGTPDCIFVAKDMPDNIAYALAKGMYEQRDELAKQYPSLGFYDPKTCWEPSKVGDVPVHPGAAQFYKEMGWMK